MYSFILSVLLYSCSKHVSMIAQDCIHLRGPGTYCMRLDSSPQLLHAQLKITQLASFAFCRFLVYCCIKVLPNLIFTLAIFNFFQWPTFFSDLLQCLQFGAKAVDMYLRILKAIDEEVVDRDVTRNQQVCVCLNWTIISSNLNINAFFLFFIFVLFYRRQTETWRSKMLSERLASQILWTLGIKSWYVFCFV